MSACAHRHIGRFCPDCGKDLSPPRYDRRMVIGDLVENWWEKGAVTTLVGLFLRPGKLIRAYIERDRDLLVKPVPYAAIVIAFAYWARARVPGLGGVNTGESATLTLLMRDPLVPTVLAALLGAGVISYITHRPAALSLSGAFVLRLYLAAQALLLILGIDFAAVQLGQRGSMGHDVARYAVSFGWIGYALWQFFRRDGLRLDWLRAAGAVILGEVALFLLLIMPIVISDELGWAG
jgi:hypothetical protein